MTPIAAAAFCPSMRRLSSSWCYVKDSFFKEFETLEKRGELSESGSGEMIWDTGNKFVLKIALDDGSSVVYKSFRNVVKPAKFVLRPSPCGFEAHNYSLIGALGIPVPELLAAGDTRKNFILEKAFLITRFAEGFFNGRQLLKGELFQERSDLMEELLRRNMPLLARCHDGGIIHRGFTLANLMWKELPQPDSKGNKLELLWIDFGSCRRRPLLLLNSLCHLDLALLFKHPDLSKEQKAELIELYCASRKKLPPRASVVKKRLLS